ncbi:MAG: BamA/TamA family outer membrane protein [Ignavibacteriales bacterium]|nr:BamA/TamA family outer membrane protein [Ignavibacteriales bacterium]
MHHQIFRIVLILSAVMPLLARAQGIDTLKTRITVIKPDFHEVKARYPHLNPFHSVQRPRVALVLSGGGARGIAAIGVLRVLEHNNVPIDLIVGTSMGSVIGGLYAMGYSTKQLQRLADTTNWDDLLSYSDESKRRDLFLDQKIARDKSILVLRFEGLEPVIPEAFSSGQRLSNYLNFLTLQGLYHPDPSFNDLRIPFRAVTTDLVTGKRIVLDSGDMTEALRASMAIPLLFSSMPRDSMQLLDGGLVDNLPVDVAIAEKADIVIAVDMVSPLRPKSKLNAPWEIADQITTIMMQEANKLSRAKADIVITPNLGDHQASDFSDIDSLITAGEFSAEELIPTLKRLIDDRTHRLYHADSTIRYESPRFSWSGSFSPVFQDTLQMYEKRGWITEIDLQRFVNGLYDEGDYVSVNGIVERHADSTIIEIRSTHNPILRHVKILGNQIIHSDTLLTVFQPMLGTYLNAHSMEQAVERLLAIYRAAGYSLARVTNIQLDSSSATATVMLDEGTIYRIDIYGTKKSRDWIIWRELPFKEQSLFNISQVSKGISNLYGTSLFEQILVTTHHEDSTGKLNIITIKARERSTELIRFGLRVDNERNIQPSIDIRDENLFGTGAETGLLIGGGTRNQTYLGELKAIRLFNSYLTFGFKGYILIRDVNVYDDVLSSDPYLFERDKIGEYREVRKGGLVSFGTQLERLGTVTVEGRLERHNVYNIYNQTFNINNQPFVNQEYNISSIRFGTNIDTQDKLPYPTDGIVINFSYESALIKVVNAVGFTKMFFSYEKYQTIIKNHTLHPRIMIGVADETLPISEEFSLGGQENFFGFREDNARGKQLMVASLEYQYKLPFSIFFDTYFKTRYDLGAVWSKTQEMRLEDFKHGIGITLGLDTPIGPADFSLGRSFYLRTDLLHHPVSFGPFVLYFSVGYPIAGVVRN